MDLPQLESILRDVADAGTLQGADGMWQLQVRDTLLAVMSDLTHDRMRIIAPIVQVDEAEADDLDAAMEANFHTALDARYATSDGVVYAAFLHPLASLASDLLRSAIDQVVSLVETYGTTFRGGDLAFARPPDDGELN
jgi:hypothetical protein